jgi:peptidoglycan hydrolase CwlO-like protein
MSAHVTAPVYVPAIYVVHLIVAQNLLESKLDLFSPQCSAVVSCCLSAEASAEALAEASAEASAEALAEASAEALAEALAEASAEASAEALAWSSESQSGRHSVVPKVHH